MNQGNKNKEEENKNNKFNENNNNQRNNNQYNNNQRNNNQYNNNQRNNNQYNNNQYNNTNEGPKDRITKGNDNNTPINDEDENIPDEKDESFNNNKKYMINNHNKRPRTFMTGKQKTNPNIKVDGVFNNINKKIDIPETIKHNDDEIYEYHPQQNQPKIQNEGIKAKTNIQRPRKLYTSMKKYFFNDYEQRYLKLQKITDLEKEEIEKELINEMQRHDNNLKTFCINYIEENVLPIFQKKNLRESEREILKYNVETIAKCCGLEKDHYRDAYYPELNKKKVVDRKKSVEALKKFRLEFNISEKDYADEGILNKLEENNLDIYKTFQKIFGI